MFYRSATEINFVLLDPKVETIRNEVGALI